MPTTNALPLVSDAAPKKPCNGLCKNCKSAAKAASDALEGSLPATAAREERD